MTLHATTWQTVGPFFRIGMAWLYCDSLAGPQVAGERIEISGRVFDGDGKPVPDAVLETWQADAAGRYAHPDDVRRGPDGAGFTGFGRFPTDEAGRFRFTTIKPGRVAAPAVAGGVPPDLATSAASLAAGIGSNTTTGTDGPGGTDRSGGTGRPGGTDKPGERMQAPHIAVSVLTRGLLRRLVTRIYFPDEPGNADDFALGLVEPARRATLIAAKVPGRAAALEWNVVLQGPNETVFFDI
jgi:protocatechuate 3,4-dioxygenase alpha subunit